MTSVKKDSPNTKIQYLIHWEKFHFSGSLQEKILALLISGSANLKNQQKE